MKKKSLIFGILLLGVVFTASRVSGTYARYITTDTGTGQAAVAKWAVSFKDGSTPLTGTWTLTLNQENNTYVAKEKIAPAASVYKDLVVDLTGTEVATDITATLGTLTGVTGENTRFHLVVSEVVGETATPITPDASGNYVVKVGLNAGRTAISKDTVTFRVELVWDNVEAQNANDTTMGEAAGNITAEITLTAKQHIAADDPVTP